MSPRQFRIDALRDQIDRIERRGNDAGVLGFGVAAIDDRLPGGGLSLGALHEVAGAGGGGGAALGDQAAATLFAAAVLARRPGTLFWCLRHRDLFAPALAGVGLSPDRLIYAEARSDAELLAAMEECLRHGGLAGVVGEVGKLSMTASRRLQLAAEGTGTPCFVLRGGFAVDEPSAAVTRWQVSALPSAPLPVRGLGRARWRLGLARVRGGNPFEWLVEAPDAQGHLAVVADAADRSAASGARRSRRTAATG